jgi:hypothetical protein
MNQGMQQMGKGQQMAGMTFGQPANQPRGKTPDSMNEIMALARKMSDAQLADVLAGRSLDIPQFAAMTEAMGRRSLRTAVQGAQAMTQARQPSVKDKLLAEAAAPMMAQPMQDQAPVMAAEGGLASLPAPNMNSVDMADGGIVAFNGEDNDQLVEPKFGTPEYDEKYGAPGSFKRKLKGIREYYQSPSSMEGVGRNISNTMSAMGPVAASTSAFNVPRTGGAISNLISRAGNFLGLSGTADAVLGGPSGALPVPDTMPDTTLPKADEKKGPVPSAEQALRGGRGGAGGAPEGGMPSYDELLKRRSTDYLSKFEGMGDKKRAGLKDLKNQLQGQLLLQGASALLGNPNLARAGAQFGQQAASTVSAGRAEQREVENQADQYDFNIAKAREAAEKGDMQLAMQYAQLANQNKYQMGMIDVYKQRNAIMGEAGNLGKVQMGLKNADTQAFNEAKARFANVPMNKKNQAAFDDYVRRRAQQLKMENPLTKPYANLGSTDLGMGGFNVVQSLPKGASVVDLE